MRVVRVMSSDRSCEPDCPEWLSLEGVITPGTAPAFAEAISHLGGRRLPILIHSHGGAVGDALAMGRLIRDRRLAVAVARTRISNCPENARSCPNARGEAITGGAACASACVLVLAGGLERLVGPVPLVGVHQITTMVKRVEGAAHLTSTRKFYEQESVDTGVMDYLTAMGVGDPVMTWLRKTPAASIHWLSLADLNASHLATLALDPAAPIVSSGATGLNGHAFEGDPAAPNLIAARGAVPVGTPDGGPMLEAALSYRRGGGAIVLALIGRGAAKVPSRWTVSLGEGEPLMARTPGAEPARALIPRDRFCALGPRGRILATLASEGSAGAAQPKSAALDLAEMDGAAALIAEACP